MPLSRLVPLLLFILISLYVTAQDKPSFEIKTYPEICERGSAILDMQHPHADSMDIRWSSGENNVKHIQQVASGNYQVRVFLRYKKDTLFLTLDTTLHFEISKQRCPLMIPKYFSPNDDGYNDLLDIGNIGYYPNFELSIYDKWGQRVHHQQHEFEKWDGRWLSAALPDGTYYYVLFYDNNNRRDLIKGDVTILR